MGRISASAYRNIRIKIHIRIRIRIRMEKGADADVSSSFMMISLLNKYETIWKQNKETDVFKWWKEAEDGKEYRFLPAIARRLLSCPPSSVASERLFSEAGQI